LINNDSFYYLQFLGKPTCARYKSLITGIKHLILYNKVNYNYNVDVCENDRYE